MNRNIIAVCLLLLSSCSHDYKREVFLGFQLGESRSQTDTKYQELHRSGALKKYSKNDDVFYYYTYTNSVYQKNYYAMMLFNSNPLDSIISSIDVVYLDNLNNSLGVMDGTRQGMVEMNLNTSPQENERLSSDLILQDVVNDLSNKYGKFDSKVVHTGAMGDRNVEEYKWKNRKDVDITLTYSTNTAHHAELQSQGFNVEGAASLVLEYAYIDEVKKKLSKASPLY